MLSFFFMPSDSTFADSSAKVHKKIHITRIVCNLFRIFACKTENNEKEEHPTDVFITAVAHSLGAEVNH